MSEMEALLKARNELEFFVILSSLSLPQSRFAGVVRLTSDWSQDKGHVLALTIHQTIRFPDEETGRVTLSHRQTHTFRLSQEGELTWQILGQPIISGLSEIQKRLELLRQALSQVVLPEPVTAAEAIDGHL